MSEPTDAECITWMQEHMVAASNPDTVFACVMDGDITEDPRWQRSMEIISEEFGVNIDNVIPFEWDGKMPPDA